MLAHVKEVVAKWEASSKSTGLVYLLQPLPDLLQVIIACVWCCDKNDYDNFFSHYHITKRLKTLKMTSTWRIHHVPHTYNVMNRYNTTSPKGSTWDPDTKKQQTFMNIGPGDQSEEVHPSMMIDRRQTKDNMRKSCKVLWHFTQRTQTPWNKQPNIATAGMNMNLHMRDPRRS